ncbi:hypothetical protein AB4251_05040 [Vibrio lentus]|uniref:Uncharacterized protein n=1 Tax=Vibrio lentus TaxID=136468 RepID=A0AB36XKW5_9VIBR|nr:hypothetical protein [Vibrio lentus]MCC4835462.1 hypothetical protein [Vibrio lentus]PMI13455.1 hypothetical protein BCU51_21390 [Vibrio lentus]PMK38259.1 hypothetical protein BCU02_00770 [Vibrio lentus]PMK45343.1 hypothetical protein BCT99_23110 [Vibrio lentus]PML34457.1 hypothetical protein BCT79_10005 [Vibrio lentus]
MNIKTIVALTLIFPSLACAQTDAILDVAGEIQINGQTVINNQGQFVGGEVFKKSDFHMLGEYHYHSAEFDTVKDSVVIAEPGLWSEEITTVSTQVRTEQEGEIKNPNYIPGFYDEERTPEEYEQCDLVQCYNEYIWSDKEVENIYVTTNISTWKNIETNGISNMQGSWSNVETKNGQPHNEYSGQSTYKAEYEELVGNNNDNYRLGTSSPGYLNKYTSIGGDRTVGEVWFEGNDFAYTTKIDAIELNGIEYKNCLSESDGEEIVCQGIGIVQHEYYGILVSHISAEQITAANAVKPSKPMIMKK